MVRMVLAAADSLASSLDRSKLGTAMAAMIRMMATTISSSINEKPFCLRMCENLLVCSITPQVANCWAIAFLYHRMSLTTTAVTSPFGYGSIIDQSLRPASWQQSHWLSVTPIFGNDKIMSSPNDQICPKKGKDMVLLMSPVGSYPPQGTF